MDGCEKSMYRRQHFAIRGSMFRPEPRATACGVHLTIFFITAFDGFAASPQRTLPIRAVNRLRRFIKDRPPCAVKRCIRLESEMRQ
jgi:hypothetical protein